MSERFQMPTPTATSTRPRSGSRRPMGQPPRPVNATPAIKPRTTRVDGPIQPRLNARLRKKSAPKSSAKPPAQARPRPLTARSRSANDHDRIVRR